MASRMTIARTDRWRRAGLALAAAVGAAWAFDASAQNMSNSAHDLSASSTVASGVRAAAGTDTDTCKFCHIPHRAQTTKLLWNHTMSSPSAVTWGTDIDGNPKLTTDVYGTQLPSVSLKPASRRCLSCHDGSISLGSLTNTGSGPGVVPMATVAGKTDSSGRLSSPMSLIGVGGDMSGHHPVGIPYAGQGAYHESPRSEVPALKVTGSPKGGYWDVKTSGCASPSGVCTQATGGSANGGAINLLPDVEGGNSNFGIECTTCHDPHDTANGSFLRVNPQFDGLCTSCHNK